MAAGLAITRDVQTMPIVQARLTDANDYPASTSAVRTRDATVQTSDKEKAENFGTPTIAANQPSTARIFDLKTRSEAVDIGTTPATAISRDANAERIMRAHFANDVLSDLKNIRTHCGDPSASPYVNRLLRTILRFRDRSPLDPFLEILMALYDSMIFENRWTSYDAAQYEGAYTVVRAYASQHLDNKKISKGIMKLQRLGFDTIPFGFDIDPYSTDDEEQDTNGENL